MKLSALIKIMQAISSPIANAFAKTTANTMPHREPSWYVLPAEVKQLLMAAAQTWEDTAQSGQYIQQALTAANDNLDVLVAAYRYFFYKHNDLAALQVASQVVEKISKLEGLPTDWSELAPLLKRRKEEPIIRLYLNAYAASGLVKARLGEVEQAKQITAQVSELDDRREFGATTIFEVLTQPPEEE